MTKLLPRRVLDSAFKASLLAAMLGLCATVAAAQAPTDGYVAPNGLACNALCRAWMGYPEPTERAVAAAEPTTEAERPPRRSEARDRSRSPRGSDRVAGRSEPRPAPSRPPAERDGSMPLRTTVRAAAPERPRSGIPQAPEGGRAAASTAPVRAVVAPVVRPSAAPTVARAEPAPVDAAPVRASRSDDPPVEPPEVAPEPVVSPPPKPAPSDPERWRTAGFAAPPAEARSVDPAGAARPGSARPAAEPLRVPVRALVGADVAGLADLDGRPVAAVATVATGRSARELFLSSRLGIDVEVTEAPSGAEAVARLRAGEVDAVLIADADAEQLAELSLDGLRLLPVPLASPE